MSTQRTTPPQLRLAAAVRMMAGLDDDDHVAEYLDRLAVAVRDCIDGAEQCGITVDMGGRAFTAAASGTIVVSIDEEQYALDNGPCLHAARTGTIVVADCTVVDDRWPEFGAAPRAAGIDAMLCAPVICDGRPVGSLTLFSTGPGRFDDTDLRTVDVAAGAVGDALQRHENRRALRTTVDGLRDALDHRAPIEQAKGILMALRGIDDDAAFTVLSTQSQRLNRKVRDIAADFVESVSASAPPTSLG